MRSRPYKVPKPMAPVYLAGAFSRERCEVRLHCEVASGPLEDPNVLAWPDMLVLTGLTTSLDRMRHLTAYAKTRKSSSQRAGPPFARCPVTA